MQSSPSKSNPREGLKTLFCSTRYSYGLTAAQRRSRTPNPVSVPKDNVACSLAGEPRGLCFDSGTQPALKTGPKHIDRPGDLHPTAMAFSDAEKELKRVGLRKHIPTAAVRSKSADPTTSGRRHYAGCFSGGPENTADVAPRRGRALTREPAPPSPHRKGIKIGLHAEPPTGMLIVEGGREDTHPHPTCRRRPVGNFRDFARTFVPADAPAFDNLTRRYRNTSCLQVDGGNYTTAEWAPIRSASCGIRPLKNPLGPAAKAIVPCCRDDDNDDARSVTSTASGTAARRSHSARGHVKTEPFVPLANILNGVRPANEPNLPKGGRRKFVPPQHSEAPSTLAHWPTASSPTQSPAKPTNFPQPLLCSSQYPPVPCGMKSMASSESIRNRAASNFLAFSDTASEPGRARGLRCTSPYARQSQNALPPWR